MGSFTGAIIAGIVALGVGTATVIGLVQSRVSEGEKPNGGTSQVVDYGTNAQY